MAGPRIRLVASAMFQHTQTANDAAHREQGRRVKSGYVARVRDEFLDQFSRTISRWLPAPKKSHSRTGNQIAHGTKINFRCLSQETASSNVSHERKFREKPSLAALFLDPNADMTFLVNINESPHAIEDAQLSEIESQILVAVRAGGAFVDLPGRSGRTVRILVTPASAIRIERLPPPVDTTDHEEDFCDLTFIDLDML